MLPVKIDLNKAEIKKFYVSGREMGRGKSGTLYLAECEDGSKWILKHNFPHLAASEFLYHRITKGLAMSSPKVSLINYWELNDETKKLFVTPYIVAIQYLEVIVRNPSMEEIHNLLFGYNYYKHKMLQYIFRDRDSFDVIIGGEIYNNRVIENLYRLDVSESFFLPTGLDKNNFFLKTNDINFIYPQMDKFSREWNEDCIYNITRWYFSQMQQICHKRLGDKECNAHISGMYTFRKTAEKLRNLPVDFFWKLCEELGTSYNSFVMEMFMLYFIRMRKWLDTLIARLNDEDPWKYSIIDINLQEE